MMIQYVTGDATEPVGEGPKIITHVCNDIGGWGRGFVLALSAKWEEPEKQYRAWHNRQEMPPFELGQMILVEVEPELWVANMIGQHGMYNQDGKPPVRYTAIRRALFQVAFAAQTHGASVHMPRIGCGLAGGEWALVEPIIYGQLVNHGIAVTVYDLPEKD